jgi:formate dehydrogenase maturation protein FdhE
MDYHFDNRLSGRQAQSVWDSLLLGEYVLHSSDDSIAQHGLESSGSADRVVPLAGRLWSLQDIQNATTFEDGEFIARQFPPDFVVATITELGLELEELAGEESWQQWCETSPLPRRIDDTLELDPFERRTFSRLFHLQEICRRPKSRLETTVERQRIHRVRRVAPRAIEYLASHPEDWAQRKLRAVLPSRVLAFRNEENLNTYENQVTARLIDELVHYMQRRIAQLHSLQDLYEMAGEYSNHLRGTWRLSERLASVWGESLEADEKLEQVRRLIERIRVELRKLQSMMDSDLYAAVPVGTNVGSRLKNTNVLVNDQHYRIVAMVWRDLVTSAQRPTKEPEQLYRRWQDYNRGYDAFARLLVVRALDESGYRASGGSVPGMGQEVVLEHDVDVSLVMRVDEQGVITLERGVFGDERAMRLRLVPLPAVLSAIADEQLEEVIARLDEAAEFRVAEEMTVFLYPQDDEAEQKTAPELRMRLDSLAPHLATGHSASLLPADPFALDSQEKVAMALRWWLDAERYLAYPQGGNWPSFLEQSERTQDDWLEFVDSRSYVLRRAPTDEEWKRFERFLERAKRHHATEARRDAAHRQKQIDRLQDELHVQRRFVEGLQRCPVCPDAPLVPTHALQSGSNQTFQCQCTSCGTGWGTLRCGGCKERFPFIRLDGLKLDAEELAPGWLSQYVGRDVLSSPCWSTSGASAFICPKCGGCANSDKPCAENCFRCRHQS